MLRQMRHDVWATTQLFERCRALTSEQWQLTAPGTYGPIQKTFAHIVRANEGYLNTYGVIPQPFIELTAPLNEIASRLARVRDAVEELFKSKELDFDRRIHDERRKAELDLWASEVLGSASPLADPGRPACFRRATSASSRSRCCWPGCRT